MVHIPAIGISILFALRLRELLRELTEGAPLAIRTG